MSGGERPAAGGERAAWAAPLIERTWWSKKGFSLALEKPGGFRFEAGQSIQILHASLGRDYTIASAPDEPRLLFCVRLVEGSLMTSWLSAVPLGTPIPFSGPGGVFVFRRSPRHAVLVATGTGIAPFLSMARAGLRGFTLLHGVRERVDLFGEETLRAAAARYVPCLSAGGGAGVTAESFSGRVTEWIPRHLAAGSYDFYLCGGREMIRDVTRIVDDQFPDSRVYTEVFY